MISFFNGQEYQCGYEKNPSYANNGPWFQKDENVGYYNMNQCLNTVCEIEYEFATSVANALRDPFEFKAENLDNYQVYHEGRCEPLPNNDFELNACCGPEFQRYPYSTDHKKCCNFELVDVGSPDC